MRHYSIIPWPVTYKALYDRTQNLMIWYSRIKIHVRPKDAALLPVAAYLARTITKIMVLDAVVETTTEKPSSMHAVEFRLLDQRRSTLGPEGYRFSIDNHGVRITAASPAGAFYAVQTFIQLMTLELSTPPSRVLPMMRIEDAPRFSWRGMHLDVSRHFFDVDHVKKYLDILALHKFNVFHWHLTDDQGWRIQIDRYPRLTDVGAYRKEAAGEKYGGFYTKDDIREVVAYAADRFIAVVPEIELPGHARAALAAYPEYSCTGGPIEVPSEWGVFEDVFCPGNEATFEFLENILAEVIELFPGRYLHIGGDECPKARWQQHDKCQALMKREGLDDDNRLQSYFISRIGRFLESRGKRLIGWDEILEGGLPEGATVMSWRGEEGALAAARAGHEAVMCPTSHCYFDYYQADHGEPRAFEALLTLEKVYDFEPVPKGLKENERRFILGGQGNVWTEYMADWDHVEYMAVPRLCALAEALWSPSEDRDYDHFKRRLRTHVKRLDYFRINYRTPD